MHATIRALLMTGADPGPRTTVRRETPARRFRAFSWVRGLRLLLALTVASSISRAEPEISEFMASNATTLQDEDGAYSDWIEIHNPDPIAVSLDRCYLSDTAANRTKWQFPAISIPPGEYLLVWASNKNRRDPGKPLHTNFALSAGGEYLGLAKPDGTTVVSEFSPTFPPQRDDVSYGISQDPATPRSVGFLAQPTPGRANGVATPNALAATVTFSRPSGPFRHPFSLQLAGASAGQRLRYVASGPSVNGFNLPVPTAASPEYSGSLTIARSTVIRAAVFSSDGTASGPIGTAHYVELDASLDAFTSALPVLVLDGHGAGPFEKEDGDHPAWLYAFAPGAAGYVTLGAPPEAATPLESSVRGFSAATFLKKSHNLKFMDELGAKRAQSLFGSAAFEKWALVGPWLYDRALIANPLAYSLSNRIGRWAPRTWITEVYYNTGARLDAAAYYGVCVLTDRVEPGAGRVAITPLTGADLSGSALTGGYLLKIDSKDDDEFGFVTEHGVPEDDDAMVVVAYPKDADLAPVQRDYIRTYVQAMEDTLYADAAGGWASRAYLDYIDRASWVDHHILNTLAANPDAFRRSAYFSKDRDGRLVAGPLWDFDRAFNSPDVRNVGPEGWRGEVNPANVWDVGWWRTLCRDPEFIQDWIDRWQELRRAEFSPEALVSIVDSLAGMVGPDAAARDAARWPDNASSYGTYADEIAALKSWLTRRADWIDRQFLAAPTLERNSTGVRITPPPGAQLAFTLDGSDPRSLGGDLASNASLSSEAVDFPADANLHVRSYNAGPGAGFPTTPWSSARGTDVSSPLKPAARVINASARGLAGSPDAPFTATFRIADTHAKPVLTRAIGPGLEAFAQSGTLPDPELILRAENGTEICRNAGWDADGGPALAALFRAVGAFALGAGSADAAATTTLPEGSYLLEVASPSGRSGLALAEFYAVDGNGRLLNLSFRGGVGPPEGAWVAGFVLQGPAYKRMLIRATTPVADRALATGASGPRLALYAGANEIATNDRWDAAANAPQLVAAFQVLGLTGPSQPAKESAAIFITLAPGVYTAVARSVDGSAGAASITIQEVP